MSADVGAQGGAGPKPPPPLPPRACPPKSTIRPPPLSASPFLRTRPSFRNVPTRRRAAVRSPPLPPLDRWPVLSPQEIARPAQIDTPHPGTAERARPGTFGTSSPTKGAMEAMAASAPRHLRRFELSRSQESGLPSQQCRSRQRLSSDSSSTSRRLESYSYVRMLRDYLDKRQVNEAITAATEKSCMQGR